MLVVTAALYKDPWLIPRWPKSLTLLPTSIWPTFFFGFQLFAHSIGPLPLAQNRPHPSHFVYATAISCNQTTLPVSDSASYLCSTGALSGTWGLKHGRYD